MVTKIQPKPVDHAEKPEQTGLPSNPSGVSTVKPDQFSKEAAPRLPEGPAGRTKGAERLFKSEQRGFKGLFKDMEERFGKIDWPKILKNR